MQIAVQKSHRCADNRGVGADADRQRYRSDGSESRILSQHSKAVADVAIEVLQPADSTFIAALIFKPAEIAESALCLKLGLLRIHPEFGVLEDELFEMKQKFPV